MSEKAPDVRGRTLAEQNRRLGALFRAPEDDVVVERMAPSAGIVIKKLGDEMCAVFAEICGDIDSGALERVMDRMLWCEKLAWFVLRNMSRKDISFYDAFAGHFTDKEVRRFDELTDLWFGEEGAGQ